MHEIFKKYHFSFKMFEKLIQFIFFSNFFEYYILEKKKHTFFVINILELSINIQEHFRKYTQFENFLERRNETISYFKYMIMSLKKNTYFVQFHQGYQIRMN